MFKGGISLNSLKSKLLKRLKRNSKKKKNSNKIKDCWWNGNAWSVHLSIPWVTLIVKCVALKCHLHLQLRKFTKKSKQQMWVKQKISLSNCNQRDSKLSSKKSSISSILIGKIQSKKSKRETRSLNNWGTNLWLKRNNSKKYKNSQNPCLKNQRFSYLQDLISLMTKLLNLSWNTDGRDSSNQLKN